MAKRSREEYESILIAEMNGPPPKVRLRRRHEQGEVIWVAEIAGPRARQATGGTRLEALRNLRRQLPPPRPLGRIQPAE